MSNFLIAKKTYMNDRWMKYTYYDDSEQVRIDYSDGRCELIDYHEGRVVRHECYYPNMRNIYGYICDDADGCCVLSKTYTYDSNGDLILECSSDGSSVEYMYEDGKCVYSEKKNMSSISDICCSKTLYTYDKQHRLIKEQNISNGSWIEYSYDDRGNCMFKKHSSGETIYYIYDQDNNRIREFIEGHDGYIRYLYDDNGNLVEIQTSTGLTLESYEYIEMS